jgi:hypothetical protein
MTAKPSLQRITDCEFREFRMQDLIERLTDTDQKIQALLVRL